MLSRDEILKVQDARIVEIPVSEWGASVCVRVMTGRQRDEFEQACQDARKKDGTIDIRGLKVRLLVQTICDESGNPLFTKADVETLNAKSSKALDQIFQVAQKLNALTNEDVGELAGNLPGDQNGSSGSN